MSEEQKTPHLGVLRIGDTRVVTDRIVSLTKTRDLKDSICVEVHMAGNHSETFYFDDEADADRLFLAIEQAIVQWQINGPANPKSRRRR